MSISSRSTRGPVSAAAEAAGLRKWLFEYPEETLHSFDVFDTAVTRLWECPSDLFLALGMVLRRRGIIAISPVVFSEARDAAERAARNAHPSGETTLEEIYRQLARDTGIDPRTAAAIAMAEIEMERRSVRPIATIINLMNELVADGRQVVLTSDTYLSAKDLSTILAHCGLDLSRVGLFLSSAHHASKRKGDIYSTIRTTYRAPFFTHLGDRNIADVENARAAGFDSRLFMNQRPSPREMAARAGRSGDPAAVSAAVGCARAARLRGSAQDARAEAIRTVGAIVAGPLLTAFVGWVLRSAAEAGIAHLLFLARDGQILQRIATRLAPAMGLAIDCRYSYGSRQALYLPSVRAVGDPPWTWLCRGMEGRKVAHVLARFGLDESAVGLLDLPQDAGNRIIDPALALELRRKLEAGPIARLILDEATRRRMLAREYFAQEIGSAGGAAIVDLGWKGRLQLCIERILDAETGPHATAVPGYYFALDDLAAIPRRGRWDAFTSYRQLPNPVLLESFTLADHGSLLGFRRSTDGNVEPMLAAPDHASITWGLHEQQAGIMDFAEFFLDAANVAGFDVGHALADLEKPALKAFAGFVRSPSLSEAAAYGDLEHSDDQAHHGVTPIAPLLAPADLAALAFGGSLRSGRRLTYWPQASLRRFAAANRPLAAAVGTIVHARGLFDDGVRYVRRRKRALVAGGRALETTAGRKIGIEGSN